MSFIQTRLQRTHESTRLDEVSTQRSAPEQQSPLAPECREVLRMVEPEVHTLIQRHRSKRRLWYPSDMMPADEQLSDEDRRLLECLPDNARGLPDGARVSIALNLLTEEGLPHFHRLVSSYLGDNSAFAHWNNMWTAEEDRHGAVLRDYIRAARIFKARELDCLQYCYIEAGFDPNWGSDPYQLIAYTSLQERATQWAHAKTARFAGKYEPVIRRILGHIAGDESRHHAFYRGVFDAILKVDPNRALTSLSKVMPSLKMPGHTIPEYDAMAEVVHRLGIYGPRQYKEIVEELLIFWKIGDLTDLSSAGRRAQDALMALPQRLKRLTNRIEHRQKAKTYCFPFLYDRPIAC